MNDTIIRELSEERDELAAASKQAPDHYNTCEWGWHNYGAANPNVCTCGWPAIRDAALAPHKPACQKCHGTRETRERLPRLREWRAEVTR